MGNFWSKVIRVIPGKKEQANSEEASKTKTQNNKKTKREVGGRRSTKIKPLGDNSQKLGSDSFVPRGDRFKRNKKIDLVSVRNFTKCFKTSFL